MRYALYYYISLEKYSQQFEPIETVEFRITNDTQGIGK